MPTAYVLQSDGSFLPSTGTARVTDAAVRALAATSGQEVTYTCMPPGWVKGSEKAQGGFNPDAGSMVVDAGGTGTTTCTSQPTRGACETCCATSYASEYTAFTKLELACACASNLCGPLDADGGDKGSDGGDGGTGPTGDAGSFGEGVCAATCSSGAAPSTSCNTCVSETLGKTLTGPCANVITKCEGEAAECAPFLVCVVSCP